MTVRELITELEKADPERLVIMSRDSEGNNYSPLHFMWKGAYRAESTWSGNVGLEKLTAADRREGYSAGDVIKNGVPCVVLTPTN